MRLTLSNTSPTLTYAAGFPAAFSFVLERDGPLGVVTQALYDTFRESEGDTPRALGLIRHDEVRAIHDHEYWRAVGANVLHEAGMSRLAFVAFDAAVCCGVKRARLYVQPSVGATPDGLWGERTLDAINLADDATSAAALLVWRAWHERARAGEETARRVLKAWGLSRPQICASPDTLQGALRRLRRCARAVQVPVGENFALDAGSMHHV